MNVLTITFSIISLATTILVSQYLGANNKKKIGEIYSVAIFFNLVFSGVISLFLILTSDFLFTAMNTPPELIADGKIYMNIVGGFIFLQAMFMSFSAIFKSNRLMKETMYVSVAINIVNIIGNIIFLQGYFGIPPLGVKGVAISSVFSRAIGIGIMLWIFTKHFKGTLSLRYLKPFPKKTLKKLIIIGVPSGGEMLCYNAAQMVTMTFINTMGAYVVSTRVYAGMLAWFAYLYASAVSQASQILVGHLVGAGEKDEAYERVMRTLKPALLVTFTMSVLLYLGSDFMFSFFTNNAEIIRLGKTIMLLDIFLELGRTVNLIVIRGLQAAGDIKFPVLLGIGSMWGVAVLFGYLFGVVLGLGLVGIWIGMILDECIRAVIVYRRWKKGVWRKKNLLA